jgi:hypothetical protein
MHNLLSEEQLFIGKGLLQIILQLIARPIILRMSLLAPLKVISHQPTAINIKKYSKTTKSFGKLFAHK